MIIGCSGHISSDKDLVGKIIQYLTWYHDSIEIQIDYEEMNDISFVLHWYNNKFDANKDNLNWQIHKFADALKDIVCILTGCTREQLEDIDFKNSYLNKEWNAFKDVDEEGISRITYREMLQYLGTDLLRNQLHENVWVNALMSKYKPIQYYQGKSVDNKGIYDVSEADELLAEIRPFYPNWIITDVRFPNEAQAIKDRNGIIIKIQRNQDEFESMKVKHISENVLDTYKFDYIIDNNGTINDLIIKVKDVLIKERII